MYLKNSLNLVTPLRGDIIPAQSLVHPLGLVCSACFSMRARGPSNYTLSSNYLFSADTSIKLIHLANFLDNLL